MDELPIHSVKESQERGARKAAATRRAKEGQRHEYFKRISQKVLLTPEVTQIWMNYLYKVLKNHKREELEKLLPHDRPRNRREFHVSLSTTAASVVENIQMKLMKGNFG